jgi:hypothetical protein
MKQFLKIIFILEVNIMKKIKKITNQQLIELASAIAKCSWETREFEYDKNKNQSSIIMRSHSFISELSIFLESYFDYHNESFDKSLFIKMASDLVDAKVKLDNS